MEYYTYMKKIIISMLVVGVAVAGIILWWGNLNNAQAPGNGSSTSGNGKAAVSKDVASLVSYNLPDGWEQANCQDNPQKLYVTPAGTALDCAATPRAPISIMVDPRNTTDCQQLTAPNGVLSHTCKSLFIDGRKTIQSITEYPKSDLYAKAQTDSLYYLDTGKGVVELKYVFGAKGSNTYQVGFDQLAQSVKVQ
jgi:hypothetical protein